jgi:hypothetical protein
LRYAIGFVVALQEQMVQIGRVFSGTGLPMPEAQTILERLQKLATRDNRPVALPDSAGRKGALFRPIGR